MANITVTVTINVSLPALNGTSLDAVLTWLNDNIKTKLPANANAVIVFTNMTP
jgi:hypothetical protein